MAETNEFYIKIGADVDDAMNKLSRLSSQLSRLASSTQRSSNQISGSMDGVSKSISSAFSSIGVALTTAGITASIIGIGKAALTTAAELQQISVSFRVFTGSAESADKMLAQLKEQALNSPMQFQDIVKGAQTLLQYGLTAQQVIPITKNLGDISGGNADKFQRLSLAFGQVTASGRLMGQEARQMINAGFNPLQAISDKTGQSMAVLTQKMHDGQISVRDVAEAFDSATSYGGRFYGMADEQSKTLAGAFNKMSESISFTLAKLGEDLDKTFDFRGLYGHIATLTAQIGKNFESLNSQVGSSNFWGNLLKDLLTAIAIGLDLIIKGFKGAGMAFEDFNNLFKGEDAKNWLRELDLGVAELFGDKAKKYVKDFHDYLDSFNKKDSGENIIQRQMKNTGMRRITDKSYLASFSDDPSKSKNDGESQALKNKLDRLKQLNKEAALKIDEITAFGEQKKLITLKNSYLHEISDFIKFKQDYSNITKRYEAEKSKIIDDAAKDRAAAESNYFNETLQGLTSNYERIEKNEISRVKSLFSELQEAVSGIEMAYPKGFNDFLDEFVKEDKLSKLENYTKSLTSAFQDFGVNIFAGFSNIAGSALAGINTFGSAIAQVGSMFLNLVGDLLIQMGTSAIKLGISAEAIEKVLSAIGVPGGGLAAVGVGMLAVAAGSLLKGMASKTDSAISAKSNGNSVQVNNGNISSRASGSSYSYGGSSYSAQTIRLAIDLTGAITATQTGYQINKSLETTLRVTGRQ